MKKCKIILWTFTLSIIISLILVQLLSQKLNPSVLRYSQVEAKRFGTYVINQSLDKKFINSLDGDIFTTTSNSAGEIQMVDFDTKKVNKLLEEITARVQKKLIALENGEINDFDIADTFRGLRYKNIKKGVVCELPTGVLFSNVLLSNNGVVIPIKLNFIGSVLTNMNTKVENYGINSVYLEVKIHVEVEERISMPSMTDEVKVSTDIPLTVKVIQGSIPNYYQSQIQRDSSIFTLPIE